MCGNTTTSHEHDTAEEVHMSVRGTPKDIVKSHRKLNFFASISIPGVIFATVVFVVPLALMLAESFTNPGPENYLTALDSGLFQRSLLSTFQMAATVTLVCLVVGYPYAYALARCGKWMVGVLLIALMLSFWTSILVRSYAWQILLNDTGVINETLLALGIVAEPLRLIRTDFAVYLGMAHILIPFAILPLYAQIRGINPDLEQAAQAMGAKRWVAFTKVTLPLSLPGAAAGGILVFILALGFYITPELLGGSRESYVGTTIVQQIQAFLNTGVGAAMSVILLLLTLIILMVVTRFVGIGKILGIKGDKS